MKYIYIYIYKYSLYFVARLLNGFAQEEQREEGGSRATVKNNNSAEILSPRRKVCRNIRRYIYYYHYCRRISIYRLNMECIVQTECAIKTVSAERCTCYTTHAFKTIFILLFRFISSCCILLL